MWAPSSASVPSLEPLATTLESTDFGGDDPAAFRRQSVEPSPHIVCGWLPARLLDQSRLDQASKRPIESGGPEPHRTVRALEHFPHDGVTVLLTIRQTKQDVEPIRFERRVRYGFACAIIWSFIYISFNTIVKSQWACRWDQ